MYLTNKIKFEVDWLKIYKNTQFWILATVWYCSDLEINSKSQKKVWISKALWVLQLCSLAFTTFTVSQKITPYNSLPSQSQTQFSLFMHVINGRKKKSRQNISRLKNTLNKEQYTRKQRDQVMVSKHCLISKCLQYTVKIDKHHRIATQALLC